eukprot:CAMPEP_0172484136 /NCGR_PEP_ID=MMETSP1066-20121228/11449_1 /TAXON_ID=671091 /ORGANISM="Coscinodiscus wailesii, Strain CCMP2513" /LENGTH=555 /DNA_ID=CAMNT_0013248439 /DNA_START=21 /DNA_END=1688 /DNA_ORIENTATION=+
MARSLSRLIPVIVVLLLATTTECNQHQLPFPPNDEYNFAIFNPESFYGAPYGGFARASASRLASLPLRIYGPGFAFHEEASDAENENNDENDGEKEVSPPTFHANPHLSVSDYTGRQYACRVYKKHELSQTSRESDSLFTPPVHILPSDSDTDVPYPSPDDEDSTSPATSDIISVLNSENVLSKLAGACSQLHKGWWSYEWCHHKSFVQFHMSVKNERQNGFVVAKYVVENVVKIGDWDHDNVIITTDVSDGSSSLGGSLPSGEIELNEEFTNGDVCAEFGGKARSATVTTECCEDEWEKLVKGRSKNGHPAFNVMAAVHSGNYDVAILKSVEEEEPCRYKATVCSPAACFDNVVKDAGSVGGQKTKREIKEKDMGILAVLKRSFNGLPRGCLIKEDGWWTYEYCHGKYARQYHADYTVDTSSGKYHANINTMHMLGKYKSPKHTSPAEDHLQMLNTTTAKYYTINAIGGDVCGDEEIVDALVTGGTVTKKKKGIERSALVRFTCGDGMELVSVQEDSTCHYILDIVVEDLCHHKLFVEEVEEENEQIVKCLLVT